MKPLELLLRCFRRTLTSRFVCNDHEAVVALENTERHDILDGKFDVM